MKKLAILSLIAVLGIIAFPGCNEDDNDYETYTSTNVIISSFSLSKDDSVLVNLDTVFFSIDLQNGRIFNGDSLPYGTKIDRLTPVISMYEMASRLTLTVRREDGTDTVYNYTTDFNESVDFTRPVEIEVTSFGGSNTFKYNVEINVHKSVGDTLLWTDMSAARIATDFARPTAQKTVRNDNGLYTLTTDGSAFSLYRADTPTGSWTAVTAAIPAGADVESFTAAGPDFYILADGELYSSSDASTWTATGEHWHYIYGEYNGHVIGSSDASGAWKVLQYPGTYAAIDLPEGMPVSGTSQPVSMKLSMAQLPQIMILGGRTADGSLTGDAWSFDGTNWANITLHPIKTALENITVVPFYAFYGNSQLGGTEKPVILALGGTDGRSNNRTVYQSPDFGSSWYKSSAYMQLPKEFAATHSAQAYVFVSTFSQAAEAASWQPVDLAFRIPGTAVSTPLIPTQAGRSRATEPVSTWEVPYIYCFGGITDGGTLETKLWRATINRLTFKPII